MKSTVRALFCRARHAHLCVQMDLNDGDLVAKASCEKVFGDHLAWTPRTMSTTCVTRKLTAILHKA